MSTRTGRQTTEGMRNQIRGGGTSTQPQNARDTPPQKPTRMLTCRVRDTDILCIDHIHNDGATERREIGNTRIYQKILGMTAEEARLEYQILCRNHNWKKHITNMRLQ